MGVGWWGRGWERGWWEGELALGARRGHVSGLARVCGCGGLGELW